VKEFIVFAAFAVTSAMLAALAIIVFIGVIYGLTVGPMFCQSRFPTIETRYDLVSGCLVNTEQYGWVTEHVFRVDE
jgi:hypothetical protein